METWVKNFIWNSKWFKSYKDSELRSVSIDAFKAAHKDILDTQETDIEARANELADQKITSLLSAVDEKDVMTVDTRNGRVFIGGEEVSPERLANLRSEAKGLLEFDIWGVLYNTPKQLAENALFKDGGDNVATHTKGRAILYALATQKKILETLSTL